MPTGYDSNCCKWKFVTMGEIYMVYWTHGANVWSRMLSTYRHVAMHFDWYLRHTFNSLVIISAFYTYFLLFAHIHVRLLVKQLNQISVAWNRPRIKPVRNKLFYSSMEVFLNMSSIKDVTRYFARLNWPTPSSSFLVLFYTFCVQLVKCASLLTSLMLNKFTNFFNAE